MGTSQTDDALHAAGPEWQGMVSGGHLFISGQIRHNPAGKLVEGDTEAQAEGERPAILSRSTMEWQESFCSARRI